MVFFTQHIEDVQKMATVCTLENRSYKHIAAITSRHNAVRITTRSGKMSTTTVRHSPTKFRCDSS